MGMKLSWSGLTKEPTKTQLTAEILKSLKLNNICPRATSPAGRLTLVFIESTSLFNITYFPLAFLCELFSAHHDLFDRIG